MHQDLSKYKDFIPFPEPIDFGKFEAIGYFPYEKAQVSIKAVRVPLAVFESIINKVDIMDNKYVIIFKDKHRFDTENFALQVKDAFCKLGSWDQVMGYGGTELK